MFAQEVCLRCASLTCVCAIVQYVRYTHTMGVSITFGHSMRVSTAKSRKNVQNRNNEKYSHELSKNVIRAAIDICHGAGSALFFSFSVPTLML